MRPLSPPQTGVSLEILKSKVWMLTQFYPPFPYWIWIKICHIHVFHAFSKPVNLANTTHFSDLRISKDAPLSRGRMISCIYPQFPYWILVKICHIQLAATRSRLYGQLSEFCFRIRSQVDLLSHKMTTRPRDLVKNTHFSKTHNGAPRAPNNPKPPRSLPLQRRVESNTQNHFSWFAPHISTDRSEKRTTGSPTLDLQKCQSSRSNSSISRSYDRHKLASFPLPEMTKKFHDFVWFF